MPTQAQASLRQLKNLQGVGVHGVIPAGRWWTRLLPAAGVAAALVCVGCLAPASSGGGGGWSASSDSASSEDTDLNSHADADSKVDTSTDGAESEGTATGDGTATDDGQAPGDSTAPKDVVAQLDGGQMLDAAVDKVPCTSDKQCSALGLVCPVGGGHCVACVAHTDCSGGKICKANHCVTKSPPCVSSVECPGQVCKKASGECVDCVAHADCLPDQFCALDLCKPDVCVAGQTKCSGMAIETCTSVGSGWTVQSCGVGKVCQAGVCVVKVACGGPCSPTETCDTATDKCVAKPKVGCDPPCNAGEYCDIPNKNCYAPTCKLPDKWSPDAQKVSMLKLPGGTIGCDVNGDGKPDNALATALSSFLGTANDSLGKGIKDGTIVMLMETNNFKSDGALFGLNVLSGTVDAANLTCDLLSEAASCKYTVKPESYDLKATTPACPPFTAFLNAKVKDGKLSAGGPKHTLLVTLPIFTIALTLKLNQAQLQGDVAGTSSWDTTKKGLICGALAKKDMEAAIDAAPEEQFAALGGKATAKGLIGSMIKTDMDADGDGTKESASVAIQWESVKGTITGLTPPKN